MLTKIFSHISLPWVITASAYLILVTKMFFPHHRQVALLLFVIGIGFFVWSSWARWQQLNQLATNSTLWAHKGHVLLGLLLVAFLYVFFVLFPIQKTELSHLSKQELQQHLAADQDLLLYLQDSLTSATNNLLAFDLPNVDPATLPTAKKEELKQQWTLFLEDIFELDIIRQKYRGFLQIGGIKANNERLQAFLLAYGAYVHQYNAIFTISNAGNGNELIQRILNESDVKNQIPPNQFAYFRARLTHSDELVRLTGGHAYLKLHQTRLEALSNQVPILQSKLAELRAGIVSYPNLLGKRPMDTLENTAFTAWFPVQKHVALGISYVRVAKRDYYITPEILEPYISKLEPADVLIERRNWHMTNSGIPGFWPHVAFYTGTLSEMDQYFANEPLLNGVSVSQHIQVNYPKVFKTYQTLDAEGYPHRIIESIRPGVVLTSLQQSGNADYLSVLRPKMGKEQKLIAILEAFSHYGKSYDYNFDFTTHDSLVCSELVYTSLKKAKDFNIIPSNSNGRLLYTPNQFVQKFDEEYGTPQQEFDFVLFLEGQESTGEVIERPVGEFRTSWNRPKWSFLQQ